MMLVIGFLLMGTDIEFQKFIFEEYLLKYIFKTQTLTFERNRCHGFYALSCLNGFNKMI